MMKPEGNPATEPEDAARDQLESDDTKRSTEDSKVSAENQLEDSYDKSADGFHGKSLPEKSVDPDNDDHKCSDDGDDDNEDGGGTFMTEVNSKRRRKKMLSKEDEDLGIYEDTDDNGDDLSDTELELERLRAEKKKREQEEKDKLMAEQKLKQQTEEMIKIKETAEKQKEIAKNVRSLTDSAIKQIEKQMLTPRTDVSLDSRMSSRTWSDPRFLQGISVKDLYWRTGTETEIPVTTSMQAEIMQSR